MKAKRKELEIEKEVAAAMIRIYCRAQHRSYGEHSFCPECTILLEYVCERVLNCPYGTEKPTCEQCTVHCYAPEMREKIRKVMRYAGPRMLWRHPIMAIRHMRRVQKATSNAMPDPNR
jgi:hypothetical protein